MKNDKKELLERLKKLLKVGNNKIIVSIKSVSKSGMSRVATFRVIDKKSGNMYNLDYLISELLEYKLTNDGIKIGGCGMDVIFGTLYNLNGLAMRIDNYKGKKKTHYNYLTDAEHYLYM